MAGSRLIAVTGASGFVGRCVVRELLGRGHRVRGFVRDRAKAKSLLPGGNEAAGLELVVGDALDADALGGLCAGADACVHLIGILRERGSRTFDAMHVHAVRLIVDACDREGVRRFVHMSALGADPEGRAAYQRSKAEGERVVRGSRLDWTILRPSLIHGPGGEFTQMAADWARGRRAPWVFMPYFARRSDHGLRPESARMAPVYVGDVARVAADALDQGETIGEVYNVVGPEVVRWPEMLAVVRDHVPLGKRGQRIIPIPGELAAMKAHVARLTGMGGMLPFDEGMARMACEDSTADMSKARAHFGGTFAPFTDTFCAYASQL